MTKRSCVTALGLGIALWLVGNPGTSAEEWRRHPRDLRITAAVADNRDDPFVADRAHPRSHAGLATSGWVIFELQRSLRSIEVFFGRAPRAVAAITAANACVECMAQ